ncbi:MAG TPA: acetylxylan esterase, partial [Fimbriimonas sp.]|nr:acetylxylan esterase [Fimbriimonas sp.]
MLSIAALYLSVYLQFPDRGPAPKLAVNPFAESGTYRKGQEVGWTVTPGFEFDSKVSYTYEVKLDNNVLVSSGTLDLSGGTASIKHKAEKPGMVFMRISPSIGRFTTFGAAIEPENLKPVVPKPKDFDDFWKRKISQLRAIPEKLVVTQGTASNERLDDSTFQMDHVNGTKVYGQMAKLRHGGKFPAIVIFQWASPPYPLHPSWVTGLAEQGWLAVNVQPHDALPREPQSYYDKLPNALKNYTSIGMESRETSYFVEMYLRGVRAIDMVRKMPEWDGKTLVVMGTSMGGQQAIVAAGLNPSV